MYRLLIADDEMLEKKVLSMTLHKHLGDCCEIYEADNGRQALEQFQAHDVQIAVLDIEMPGMNGLEAAKRMKELNPDCCILFLTAFDDFNYAKKAILVRAIDYLLKPWNTEELLSSIEVAMHIVDKRKAVQEVSDQERKFGVAAEGESASLPGTGAVALDHTTEAGEDSEHQKMSVIMDKIMDFVHKNYMRDISMHEVAEAMNYSDAYFSKLFKQNFQKNFTTFLTEYRITLAKEMLARSGANVGEIGEAVGYFDPNYFAKVFKRSTGMSPSDYRLHIPL